MSSPGEEKTEKVDPKSLITEAHVKTALAKDKGSDAKLSSWTIHDFTERGDNFATIVTSVKVEFTKEGKEQSETYVVKLNPCRPKVKNMSDMWAKLFLKEIGFYDELGPELSSELTAVGERGLRIAKCFHTYSEEDREVIFLEDLRVQGFRMFQRRTSLDVAHASLMLQELARLHAASVLLQHNTHQHLTEKFEFLTLDWTNFIEAGKELIDMMFCTNIDTGINLLRTAGGYEAAEEWLAKTKPVIFETIVGLLARKAPFEVVCHGDCWNNNVLFRLV